MTRYDSRHYHTLRSLYLLAGLVLMVLATLCASFVYDRIFPLHPELGHVQYIRDHNLVTSRLLLMSIGVFFVAIWLVMRIPSRFGKLLHCALFANLSTAALVMSFLLVVPELLLRPVALPALTIFVADEHLGWKHKPGSKESVDGLRYEINNKGLIGPEFDYRKPDGVVRFLFLGDSVTFGTGVEDHAKKFVPQVGSILERRFPGLEVQAINAGVSGYSPWQHYTFLSREGLRYDPDLVIVSFVLNDVPEKMGLTRFGGDSDGYILAASTQTRIQTFLCKSATVRFVRLLWAAGKYGKNMKVGAQKKELLDVAYMVRHPEDSKVEVAWRITLGNLSKIYQVCKHRDIAVMLAIFPFTFQFDDPEGMSGPQRLLVQHAREHDVPAIDLLPVLAQKLTDEGLSPEAYFLDASHLSPVGHGVVARILADFISRNHLTHSPALAAPGSQ